MVDKTAEILYQIKGEMGLARDDSGMPHLWVLGIWPKEEVASSWLCHGLVPMEKNFEEGMEFRLPGGAFELLSLNVVLKGYSFVLTGIQIDRYTFGWQHSF